MARYNTALERLPDSVLEYVFALAPPSEGVETLGRAALPFVCHQFNRVYRSSKLLWGTMQLRVSRDASDEEVAGLVPSLRHKGAAVERLWLYLRSNKVTLSELLAHFSAEGLRALQLDLDKMADAFDLPAGQLGCLGRFTRLDHLLVIATSSPLRDDLSWLCTLKELKELYMVVNFKNYSHADTCTSISCLTALSKLFLSNCFPIDAQLGSSLAHLSRLQTLVLRLQSGCQQQLGAACFSHLQQLSKLIINYSTPDYNASLRLQLGGLSTMPRLQRLTVASNIDLNLQDLLMCSQLQSLALYNMIPDPFAALDGGKLPRGSMPALTSLEWQPELLGAEVLGLDEKSIHFPEGLCQLTQLQELRANVADNPFNIRLLFSVPAAFSQLRELRRLEMSCLHLQEVPAAMTGLSMLQCLDLSMNFLLALSFPPGPYLANLRYLNLHGNLLERIPEALASATKLEALDVSENLPYQFSADQLWMLPGLKRLYIAKRLLYCSPQLEEFENPADMLQILWSNDTLRDALQAHSRFPRVEFIVEKYMRDEEWWQQECAVRGRARRKLFGAGFVLILD